MKTISLLIIFLLLIVGSMGCQQNPANKPQSTEIEDELTHQEVHINQSTQNDSLDFLTQESVTVDANFQSFIHENQIDKAYNDEIDHAGTTQQRAQIEQKYIKIWENELDHAASEYIAVLSAEDGQIFAETQRLFSTYTEDSFAFTFEVLRDESYDIYLGTEEIRLIYAQRRMAVRERTIYVKHMHYIMEQAAGAETYASLSFCFNEINDEAENGTVASKNVQELYLDSRLFPELIAEEDNYKLFSDAQRHGYYYEIYDNSGTQLECGFAPWNLQEIAVAGENLLVLRTSATGALFSAKYYDLADGRISRVYGKPAGNSQNLIAYFDTDDQGVKLIVQDILDARVFYREFRDASFSTPIFTASTHAQFSDGDSSVSLTYMTDNSEMVTKTFDLT